MRAWYSSSSFNSPPGVNYACVGLLEKKVAEHKVRNNEFICNLCVDEMAIRQQIQWIDGEKRMIGYSTYGDDSTRKDPNVAKQAIVFVLVGVNERFQFSVTDCLSLHHFVNWQRAS